MAGNTFVGLVKEWRSQGEGLFVAGYADPSHAPYFIGPGTSPNDFPQFTFAKWCIVENATGDVIAGNAPELAKFASGQGVPRISMGGVGGG